jgi:xanthine/CO dehydrogenase XdhC/CoxF family maturation factor
MRERRQIVELWKRGNAVALATLVRVEGSSYRRVGARLLIAADGEYAGSISGGCLEAEVIRKAQWLVRKGATVQRYSTLFDDTADIPYGLGCGGTVDVLLEPAGTPEFFALMQALAESLRGEIFTIETSLPSVSRKLLRTITEGRIASPAEFDSVFTETIEPPQRLLVFGAGDDAQPLVSMAALLGWRLVVIDRRSQWATPLRFAEAEQVLTNDDNLAVNRHDAVVIMTHSYEQDIRWLTASLPAQPRYLGLLGSRHRSALLVSEAAVRLGWTLEQACAGLFAPVGLDLGGDGAESIALSTIAEIQACREGKLGTSRRMTPAVVAEQIAEGGASRYLQTQCAV